MIQKTLIGLLALAIVAVIGIGLADAARPVESLPANAALLLATATPLSQPVNVTAVPAAETPATQPLAQGAEGDPWQSSGTIARLDDFGLDLNTDAGLVYIELGPPTYWQAQGVALAVGDVITVDGFANGDQIHARVVTTAQTQLVLRTETGQPMWSGGADGGSGNTDATGGHGGTNDGTNGTPQPQIQVAPEDWVTVKGTIASASNGNVMLNAEDGTSLKLQMGQPQFWQSQGVALSTDDAVEVLGYWSNGQFMVGDILKVATGEHIILRDPNGRQLWGGPGRSGNTNGGGSGNGGNGNGGGNGGGNRGNGNNGNGSNAALHTPTPTPSN